MLSHVSPCSHSGFKSGLLLFLAIFNRLGLLLSLAIFNRLGFHSVEAVGSVFVGARICAHHSKLKIVCKVEKAGTGHK